MSMEIQGMRRLEARRTMEGHHYRAGRAHARHFNPPVDLRSLDYVSAPDINLVCPICRSPLVDPVILTDCDHCFCRDCVRRAWKADSTSASLQLRGGCPSCRAPAKLDARSKANKLLVNMIDELLVQCPKADEGCRAEVKRGEIQDHLNIYCGYALAECLAEDCELPVLRKDLGQECLHYGVSCLSCRKETQKWSLESHWRLECPERKVQCDRCKSLIYRRELEEHSKQTCAAISLPCPGAAFGCTHRSETGQAAAHANACPLAKLASTLTKQQERLDEQERAQKQLVRKVDVLERGFSSMQGILYPARGSDYEDLTASASYLPSPRDFVVTAGDEATRTDDGVVTTPTQPIHGPYDITLRDHPAGPVPAVPGPRPHDLPEPYADFDFELPSSFAPAATNSGPYASPLHHLLSMHEGLRDEMTRMSEALSELDGRHSMQAINENLRTRDDIINLGGQVGRLQVQVHWLTSAELQRQQMGRSSGTGYEASASTAFSDAAAGAGVEAAVSTAATALRGAVRMVNVGNREGTGMRRRPSEEGRTKL